MYILACLKEKTEYFVFSPSNWLLLFFFFFWKLFNSIQQPKSSLIPKLVFHPLEPYLSLLKLDGKLILTGVINTPLQFLSPVVMLGESLTLSHTSYFVFIIHGVCNNLRGSILPSSSGVQLTFGVKSRIDFAHKI